MQAGAGQSDFQQNVNTSIIPPNYGIKITITPAIVSPHPYTPFLSPFPLCSVA